MARYGMSFSLLYSVLSSFRKLEGMAWKDDSSNERGVQEAFGLRPVPLLLVASFRYFEQR